MNSDNNTFASIFINFGKLWLDKTIGRNIRLAFLIIAGQLGIIFFFFPKLPPQVPLFFSRPWGTTQLSEPTNLLLIPIISFTIFLLNGLISAVLVEKNIFLAKAISFSSIIFGIFGFFSLFKIVTLAL